MAQKHKIQIYLFPLLLPLSWIFGLIARIRAFLYACGLKKGYKANVPCICVGNISWGGTGKSPIIDYLLKYLNKNNIQSAVLSRGYGAKLPVYPFVLDKNYKEHTLNLPDEPCMLIQKNLSATVIIDPKRAEAAAFADKNLPHIKILLMDDGFQHFALARDANIVLLDKNDLFTPNFTNDTLITHPKSLYTNNWNTLIPLGSWREPKTALKRADVFLVKCPHEEWLYLQKNAEAKLAAFNKPLFAFEIVLEKLIPLFNCSIKPFSQYAILAGIGNPIQFQKSAENFLQAPCSRTFFLKDHASADDMEKYIPELLALNIPLVCTEKDAVKLQHYKELNKKEIYYTQTTTHFYGSLFTQNTFDNWLNTHILKKFNLTN